MTDSAACRMLRLILPLDENNDVDCSFRFRQSAVLPGGHPPSSLRRHDCMFLSIPLSRSGLSHPSNCLIAPPRLQLRAAPCGLRSDRSFDAVPRSEADRRIGPADLPETIRSDEDKTISCGAHADGWGKHRHRRETEYRPYHPTASIAGVVSRLLFTSSVYLIRMLCDILSVRQTMMWHRWWNAFDCRCVSTVLWSIHSWVDLGEIVFFDSFSRVDLRSKGKVARQEHFIWVFIRGAFSDRRQWSLMNFVMSFALCQR